MVQITYIDTLESIDEAMAKKRIYIFVDELHVEIEKITAELEVIRTELETTAKEFGQLPYPLRVYSDTVSAVIHSALLKMDSDKASIAIATWNNLSKRYESIPKGTLPSGNTQGAIQFYFNDDMVALGDSIAEYMQNHEIRIKYITSRGVTSYRVVAAIAIMYAASQLNSQNGSI